jgi:predicted nuclease of predicted toxin-antitoxin system
MKLLFDQNLSHKLVQALADIYPDCRHVRNIGLKTADDSVIWLYAKNNG